MEIEGLLSELKENSKIYSDDEIDISEVDIPV